LEDKKLNHLFFRLLQLSAFTVFLGRAWQHLYWDAPFRAFLWDEAWLSGFIEQWLSMDWETYITSMEVDKNISQSIKCFGILYLICAIITLFIKQLPRIFHHLLLLGAVGLLLLALLYCKERFFSVGQFFEYALQFGSPIFLWWYVAQKQSILTEQFLLIVKIAIALTFTCHGLYAIGYYPIPVQFLEMTMNILSVGEIEAKTFLTTAGILDFLVAIGIFSPWKWARLFLGYAIFWGFGTTIARVWANFNWEWLEYVLLQWLHESVMRMPHFLIPLAVYFAAKFYSKQVNKV